MIDDSDECAEVAGGVACAVWSLACFGFGLLVGIVLLHGGGV